MTKDTSLIDAFPFSSYLNSNYIPLDEEVVQIKAYLTHSRKRLEEMRAEMDGPHGQVELSVKLEYDILYDHIESCASLITLPRRVPDDVLQEIFYQTLPTDRNALLDNNAAPLMLTRISRQWRQVAFATPRLWSTIHIYVVPRPLTPNDPSNDILPGKPPPQKQDELRATAAFEWLNRSGDFPLHISLVANSDESSYPPAVEPYLSALIPFSSRWKNLVVEGHSKSFSRIFTLGSADLRSLESLILDFDPWAYDNHGRELTSSLSNCGLLTSPSLRKLSIRRVIMLHPTNLNLDWSQFTHLELGASPGSQINGMLMPMGMASEILQVCKRLVSCRIKIAGWEHYDSIHSMQLPLLRHLSINVNGDFLPFTERLEVPGLQELYLRVEYDVRGNDTDYKRCLAPLFRPQQGSIQKLVIDTRDLDHDTFLEILRKCPGLRSLTVQRSPRLEFSMHPPRETLHITIDDAFLERISSNNSDLLCPRLEEFICEYPVTFSPTGMIEFIKRKQDGNIPKLAKLKKVALVSDIKWDLHEEIGGLLPELQPYISQDLTFHISEFDTCEPGTPGYLNDRVVYGNSGVRYPDFWGS